MQIEVDLPTIIRLYETSDFPLIRYSISYLGIKDLKIKEIGTEKTEDKVTVHIGLIYIKNQPSGTIINELLRKHNVELD